MVECKKRQTKGELYSYSDSILAFFYAIGEKRNIAYKVSCLATHHHNTSEPGNILRVMIYISNCSYATLTVMLLCEMNLLQILCLNSSVT